MPAQVNRTAAGLFSGLDLTAHHTGPWGMAKTFMHTFLPHVTRCAMIDTDMLMLTDVGLMWREFENFQRATLLSLPLRPKAVGPTLAHPSGICSCIALQACAYQARSIPACAGRVFVTHSLARVRRSISVGCARRISGTL